MNKTVRFFPNREEFKSPIGGVAVGENCKFNLMFSRPSNPSEVFLIMTKDGENDVPYQMNYITTNDNDMMEYSVTLKVKSKGLYFYHFAINTENEQFRVGSDVDLNALLGKGAEWQMTVYEKTSMPKWLNGGLMYQIMVDRFFIGGDRFKTKKNVVYREDWGGTPEYLPNMKGEIENNDFFGGNLRGIIKKLGYLKGLGVTCIYLNPIFEAHSNHKYDTGNYRRVDSDFGDVNDLKELIKKADKKNIKLLLDGVFSHTGDDSIYFNKYGNYDSVGAYQSVHSPYYSWYGFKDFPDDYDCWWNIKTLPNTKEENIYFNEYINGEDGIINYWTDLGIGGWRLDVADELPNKFLDRVVSRAKKINPDALILGEVWEDASNKVAYSLRRRYLQGGQLDSVTNYPFKEDILNYIRTGDANRLNNTINVLINNYPKEVLDNLMNILDTHDTARILSVLGDSGRLETRSDRANAKLTNLPEAIKLLKMATVLQYCLPGVPCVYYGDEAGLEGFEDPFNRRCYPWGGQNKEILRWYKRLGFIRSSEKNVFADGNYKKLKADEGIMAFSRNNGIEELIIIINNSGSEHKYTLDGYTDLVTNKIYNGKLTDKSAVILKKTEQIVKLI